MQQSKLKWHHIIKSGIKIMIKIRSIKVIINNCSVYKWLFSSQHFSLNIGSEVLRLQDFAQIILKFSWTDISQASGILKGPVVQKFYWPKSGPVKKNSEVNPWLELRNNSWKP